MFTPLRRDMKNLRVRKLTPKTLICVTYEVYPEKFLKRPKLFVTVVKLQLLVIFPKNWVSPRISIEHIFILLQKFALD